MNKLASSLLIGICSMMLLSCQESQSTSVADPIPEKWQSLFNGENLEGWDVKIAGHPLNENYQSTFRVEEGLMTVSYDGYEDFARQYGHIFYKEPFSSYKIRLEYRFIGDQAPGGEGWAWRNSGIMVHGQSAESMAQDQDFPISIEVQLLGGRDSGERSTANLCSPGTHVIMGDTLTTQHCLNSASDTYPGDQWVQVQVDVYADSLIRHIVMGDTVMTYFKPQVGGSVVNNFDPEMKKDGQLLDRGYISLQSESHPVQFRNIELLNLTP